MLIYLLLSIASLSLCCRWGLTYPSLLILVKFKFLCRSLHSMIRTKPVTKLSIISSNKLNISYIYMHSSMHEEAVILLHIISVPKKIINVEITLKLCGYSLNC
jgi:hypothetical protein